METGMGTVTNEISVNPYAVVAAFGVFNGAVLAWLGYRNATRADREAKHEGQIGSIIAGLNSLIDQLQEDNAALRGFIVTLEERLNNVKEVLEKLREQVRSSPEHLE